MTDRMIDNRCKKLRDLEAQIKDLQRQQDAIKEELKRDLQETGAESRKTSQFFVHWTEVVTSRLDSTALKKALPDVYSLYTKQRVSRRFQVT